MEITEKCTGCMACYNMCPFSAIEVINNEKGFYVPKINKDKCKNCKKCISVCPQNNIIEKNQLLDVYAAWSKDKQIRSNSTSGGIFSIIAEKILEKQGIVIGAFFDNNFKVVHGVIKNKEELEKLRGSKYVQSYIGDILSKTKEYLEQDKVVLFSGVPCQIAGLKNYLGKDYKNLITIDILCHGVPSPVFFKDYKKEMQKLGKIKSIKFRYKKPSWTVFSMRIEYYDRKQYQKTTFKDSYIRAFLEDYTTNEVCSECKYTGEHRIGDITLADFWGYISENFKTRNTEKGISLVLINTTKGEKVFSDILDDIICIKKQFIEAQNGNKCLRAPFEKNIRYNEFWEFYKNNGYNKTIKKYIRKRRCSMKHRISLFLNNKAYMIPKKMRRKVINIRDNISSRVGR